MPSLDPDLASIFPRTAEVTADGHLAIGGCDAVELARELGTPLYVFDEEELRATCGEYRAAFAAQYAQSTVVYAAKAYLGRWLAALVAEEGLGMDVVSGGELAVARAAGFPMERVLFHGNNKSAQELREAVDANVGRIVIDNFHDLSLLDGIAESLQRRLPVLVRVSPGVDPHTHAKTTTGTVDVKFGFTMEGGRAEEAIVQALARPTLEVLGLHCHLGSPIFELEPYRQANEVMIAFARKMRDRHGLELREYNIGGGFAAQYLRDRPAPAIEKYAQAVVESLREALARHELPEPMLFVEPGRAIVARAGVALYTIGARKEIPGVRTYVSVDGGMADNIRPAMYDARYEALVANRATEPPAERVTIAGKYCESGDVLIKDIELPKLWAGDVLALPASGAYCLAMASNYNQSLRPPIVLVRDGRARLVRRRETYEDLMRADVWNE
jgi:diaminopimelate decarboxylase